MGQKCNPIGFRVGITEGWRSRWYAPKQAFGGFLVEDEKIRRYVDDMLNKRPPYAGVAKVEIERTRDEVKVYLHTSRPGMVIGAKGSEVDKLKEKLEELIDRRVGINIVEIKEPDLDARLVGVSIGEQLKKRGSFRRIMKQKCEAAMAAGARGVKIICSGRLGGADMARVEKQMLGSIPLQTLQADVDFAVTHCVTTYGVIGIKVWVSKGMYGEDPPQRQQEDRSRFRRRVRR
ncbi:MAG: 30S ribosomal protein S3 [Planctomycetia bacterium]|nr:MAG: 30S ribosomal protein S3 [Planctomycetia bacterium]